MTETTPIEVSFAFQTGPVTILPEAEFATGLAAVRPLLAASRAPYGPVFIRGGGQDELRLADELVPLADALYASLAQLGREDSSFLDFFSEPGAVRFDRDGDAVRLADTAGNHRRYPAAALLPALADCADRIVAALRRLGRTEAGWEAALAELETKGAALDRRALGR